MMFESFNVIILGLLHSVNCDLFTKGATKGIIINFGSGHMQCAAIKNGLIL